VVVSAIKLQAALRLELQLAITVVPRAMFPVIAVLLQKPSHATSAVRKATSPGIVLTQVTPGLVEAMAADLVPVPSATSVARSAILPVRALMLDLLEVLEDTTRSVVVVVVVDPKRLAILAVV